MNGFFERFIHLSDESDKLDFKQSIEKAGFSAINQWIHSLYDHVKKMDEPEFNQVKRWLECGKELFPDLAVYSPSWANTWKELFEIHRRKADYYFTVSSDQRDGEWQVLYDNPFATDGIVCHTNKTFPEATYLAAKYQLGLKRAEYVKLQKVLTSLVHRGS